MDLINITDILKELIKTHFKEKNDLNMLMQLMELIVIQYKKTNKLPDFLIDEITTNSLSNVDSINLTVRPSEVNVIDSDLNRTNKRPRLENEPNSSSMSFRCHEEEEELNQTNLISIKSEPHYIEVDSISDNTSIIDSTIPYEIKTESTEQQSSHESVKLQVNTINEQVKKQKKTPSIFNKIRNAWQDLANLLNKEALSEIELFISELNGLRLIQTQLRLINKTFYIDICTNILLIMGNIAEIDKYQSLLIKDDLLFILRVLVNDTNDLVSYLSSRIIVNLIDKLHESNYRLQAIETDVTKSLSRWNSEKMKKSFPSSADSFSKLIKSKYQLCQKWSCWSLINLTDNDCSHLLDDLLNNRHTRRSVKDFARKILKNL